MKNCIKNNEWPNRRRTSKVPDDVLRFYRDYANDELSGSAEFSTRAVLEVLDALGSEEGTEAIRVANDTDSNK